MSSNRLTYDELIESADNKYFLTLAVAKRARQLHEGSNALMETGAEKPVTIAIEEFRNKCVFARPMPKYDNDESE